jgi:hypothetical protein
MNESELEEEQSHRIFFVGNKFAISVVVILSNINDLWNKTFENLHSARHFSVVTL